MNWRFWEEEKKRDLSPAIINEQLANIAGRLDNLETCLNSNCQQAYNIDGQLAQNTAQLIETAAQLQKLARLQYKAGQETQGKLDKLMAGMEKVQQRQDQYWQELARMQLREKQTALLTEVIIKQLDNIDHISHSLKNEGKDSWQQLLKQWSVQLVQALAEAGILEIDLYGKSFDPRWAEAIATVTRAEALTMCPDTGDEALLPYQMVAVIRRGFITPEGRLLRKGQVITVQEDN